MNIIHKFDVSTSVLPNGLEKYMAFTINKNLAFIDGRQFMNFTLEKLVKYLSKEFHPGQLKLAKQKEVYPFEYINSFKRFSEDKLPDKKTLL